MMFEVDDNMAARAASDLAQDIASMTGSRVAIVLMKPAEASNGIVSGASVTGFAVDHDVWLVGAATAIVAAAVTKLEHENDDDPESVARLRVLRAALAPLLDEENVARATAEGVH